MFKKKKGAWTIFTLMIIPVLTVILFYFMVYSGSKQVMKRRVQNSLDTSLIYLSSFGDVYSLVDEDGRIESYCALDHNDLNNKYNVFLKKSIIEKINGYNKYWQVLVIIDGEETWKTFDELESENKNIGEYILLYSTESDNQSELISIKLKGYIPFARISNYNDYYKNNGDKPNSTWIEFFVEATSSCH